MNQSNPLIESASLVAKVKQLDNERNELKEKIEAAKQVIEKQKREAELISLLMKRNELPTLEGTNNQLNEINEEIEEARQQQAELQEISNELQAQIDKSIAIREKRAQYERLYSEVKILMNNYETEKAKEKELKLAHSQLSSQLLKEQTTKRLIEQKLAIEIQTPPDLEPLQRKKQSLIDQTRLVQNKREIFKQELEDALKLHKEMFEKQEKYNKLTEHIESNDPLAIQKEILQMAATNLDLHQYKAIDPSTELTLAKMKSLTETCGSLISKTNEVMAKV